MTIAISTTKFIYTLGVNTHLDFNAYGYENIPTVVSSIRYLGLSNLRDSAQYASDVDLWAKVAKDAGVKFANYMPTSSTEWMKAALQHVPALAKLGILNYLEGGNEEDMWYAVEQGNTLEAAAKFQKEVYAMGQQLGLPVINMSFGAGWTAEDNWQGNYDSVGDLSAYADFANAHTYPNVGQSVGWSMDRLNGLAHLAASKGPVITTEIGWSEDNGHTQTDIARYTLEAALDGIKYGNVKTYFYSLYDDMSGKFGLMNADGTPKPAGTALHNLTTLLKDTGATASTFPVQGLDYTLSTNDDTVLMQKSDGSFWLSIWNEAVGAHSVTVTLPTTVSSMKLYDPLNSTAALKTVSNTNKFTFMAPDQPVILQIVGASPAPGGNTGGGSGAGGNGSGGNGSGGNGSGGNGSAGNGSGDNGSGGAPAADRVITAPASKSLAAGATISLGGVVISDPWAASHPGMLALTVVATVGTISMKDASGKLAAGSGTKEIHITGTLAQLNAELATLSYTAGQANGAVNVAVWNQAGADSGKQIGISVSNALSPNPTVNVPGAQTLAQGATLKLGGVSIVDPWAASAPGALALNVVATVGTIAMKDAAGKLVAGSGTGEIHISGTLAQLNAQLSTLTYTAGSKNGAVTVEVWDQAGIEAEKQIGFTVTALSKPVITIGAKEASATINVSNSAIVATAGDHAIFIGGTGNVLTATGGNETVQAYQGRNTITTGAGADKIRFAGSNNVINAGGGNNTLMDSGSNNTIVLPTAGKGYNDIYGYVMSNGDKFDLRQMMAGTNWKGDLAKIGNFIKLTQSGNNAVISVDPDGVAGGTLHKVAMLHDSGTVSLSTLLAHSTV